MQHAPAELPRSFTRAPCFFGLWRVQWVHRERERSEEHARALLTEGVKKPDD